MKIEEYIGFYNDYASKNEEFSDKLWKILEEKAPNLEFPIYVESENENSVVAFYSSLHKAISYDGIYESTIYDNFEVLSLVLGSYKVITKEKFIDKLTDRLNDYKLIISKLDKIKIEVENLTP